MKETPRKTPLLPWLCRRVLLGPAVIFSACFFAKNLWQGFCIASLVNSFLTMLFYHADKKAAVSGEERIPEMSLHAWEFFCGWPGALAAQALFHHKSRKLSYRIVFLLIVILNIGIVFAVAGYLCCQR